MRRPLFVSCNRRRWHPWCRVFGTVAVDAAGLAVGLPLLGHLLVVLVASIGLEAVTEPPD
jgi:hypothetical protein